MIQELSLLTVTKPQINNSPFVIARNEVAKQSTCAFGYIDCRVRSYGLPRNDDILKFNQYNQGCDCSLADNSVFFKLKKEINHGFYSI